MLSCLPMRWCIRTNPLRAVIEVPAASIVKTSDHSNWHELCHVDGNEIGNLDAAHVTLHRGGWSNSPVTAWNDSTFSGLRLPSHYSQSSNRNSSFSHALLP